MRSVYIVNLSYGVAGTERRMANVWHALRERGNVRPHLVVPQPLAKLLVERGLAEGNDPALWTVRDSALGKLVRLDAESRYNDVLAHVRSRIVARNFQPIWDKIKSDADAVIHIGLDTSPLNPPDMPIVYECMDSTLLRLGGRHYTKAAARPSVINCQTDRIRLALERKLAHLKPRWTTVTSPNYFASYSNHADVFGERDPMLVAFVGRLIPSKNPLHFVEAVARVRAAGIPVHAIVLGYGSQEGLVRERIEELGLRETIQLSHVPHPGDALRRAAIFVSLQTGDNYGSQSLLEAMGAGCAVLASDVGDTRRLITPDVGRLTSFDVDEIAAALAELLRQPSRVAQMGRTASQLVRSHYSADSYAAFLEELYELAVTKHNGAKLQCAV